MWMVLQAEVVFQQVKTQHLTSQHVWELLFYTSERMASLCKLVGILSVKVVI